MSVERVTFQGSNFAGIVENVVHFNNPDGATTHAAIGAYLQLNWIGPLLTIMSTQMNWVQMIIQRVDGAPSPATTIPISPNQGTQAGDAAAPFVSALLQVATDFPGRHGRGRIYLPGCTIGIFSNLGRMNIGSYNAMQTAVLNGWRTKFLFGGSAPITLVVTSRSDPSAFHPAIGIDVRLWASVQRRRNWFIGA